eukprot:3378440-Amphidinium_carterae.1
MSSTGLAVDISGALVCSRATFRLCICKTISHSFTKVPFTNCQKPNVSFHPYSIYSPNINFDRNNSNKFLPRKQLQ